MATEEDMFATLNELVEKMSTPQACFSRCSETTHWIQDRKGVVLEVSEAARCVEYREPYTSLPEEIRQFIERVRREGYKVDIYHPKRLVTEEEHF